MAAQGTAAERSRYWTDKSYEGTQAMRLDFQGLLSKPPADTTVLLGYMKSAEHLEWIRAEGQYNLRADVGRSGAVGVDVPELTPDLLLLYQADGDGSLLLSSRHRLGLDC